MRTRAPQGLMDHFPEPEAGGLAPSAKGFASCPCMPRVVGPGLGRACGLCVTPGHQALVPLFFPKTLPNLSFLPRVSLYLSQGA